MEPEQASGPVEDGPPLEGEPAAAVAASEGSEGEPAAAGQASEGSEGEPAAAVAASEGAAVGPLSAAADAGADAGQAEHGEPEEEEEEDDEPKPRVKPEVPGLHLEVDIVPEGVDPLGRREPEDPYATDPYAIEEEEQEQAPAEEQEEMPQPISAVAIDLAAGARYRATGKRKTAIARVTLKPGDGTYLVNRRSLEQHFPRTTLQRTIRQPLETVGYQSQMDVIATVYGGGVSAQAGALRHGVSKALIEADPNLRAELKRRGFLTRDSRVKERKKAGLKKARKRPQFSKR
jgi:small subunit ribosomal protein S9